LEKYRTSQGQYSPTLLLLLPWVLQKESEDPARFLCIPFTDGFTSRVVDIMRFRRTDTLIYIIYRLERIEPSSGFGKKGKIATFYNTMLMALIGARGN